MAAIDQIVKINITQQTQAVAQASFSIPLIFGTTNIAWSDNVHAYADPSGMLSDGFTTASPEYIYAEKMFSQSVVPNQFYVGKRTVGTIAADMQAIIDQNNTWYGAIMCSNVDADILAMAAFIEALPKIFIGASNDSAIAGNGSSDLLSQLKALGYARTALVYSPGSYNLGIEAAWMGSQLPQVPGSNNWAFKSLAGIATDNLTDTAVGNVIGDPIAGTFGKQGNIYRVVGGQNITQMGMMVGGQFIDITVGLDWLKSQLQTNIFAQLVQALKIPYTDKGTGILLQAVKSAIDQGVVNGLIDGASPISISAPPVLSVPANQRAQRIAPTISFSCRLQGAFNAVTVSGTVTV